MNEENQTLLRLLKVAKAHISECFDQEIDLVQKCEDEELKNETLAASKIVHSSIAERLNNVVAAHDERAASQSATFQLQQIANSVDRALEKLINETASFKT